MDIDNLVRMANNIGQFFDAEPDKVVAVRGVKNHIRNSWESRMRTAIIRHYREKNGEGLMDIVKSAVGELAGE